MTGEPHAPGEPAGPHTTTRLADGRELIYFDDAPGADRSAVDPRDLPPHRPESQIRYDPIMDDWVIVAAQRQDRTHLPATGECPLCPSRPGRPGEIPASDYDVVAFENRFPSLSGTLAGPQAEDGLVRTRPGAGRCEVVCFTSDHDASFAGLPARRLGTVGRAWAHRTSALSLLPGVREVFVFENRGAQIGATLQHPHGQIYAYPYVTPTTRRSLDSARRHRERTGGCLFCDLAGEAERTPERLVARTDGFVAYVPHAPHWPYEVHITARRHVPDLPALADGDRDELLTLYAEVLARFDGLFDVEVPYMASWHQGPVGEDRDLAHLWIQICTPLRAAGKLKYLASSETGAGAFITDVLPEQAAARLRG